MAEDKKSFVLYCDLIHTFEKLTDVEAGQLIKHLLAYVNDRSPQSDRIIEVMFEPIKQQLKRDLIKYESKRKQWSQAGKASAYKRKQALTDVENRSTDSTVSVNDNVSVSVNVSDNVIQKDIVHGDSKKDTTSKKIETGDSLPTSKPIQSNLERFKNDTTSKETMSKYVRALGRPLTIKRIIDLAEAHDIAFNEKHSHANYGKWCEYFRYFLEKHRETKQAEDPTYEPPYRKKLN